MTFRTFFGKTAKLLAVHKSGFKCRFQSTTGTLNKYGWPEGVSVFAAVKNGPRKTSKSVIEVAKISQQELELKFGDETYCTFNNIWLRDSCQCPACVHPATKQKLVDSPSIPLDIYAKDFKVDENGNLEVIWASEKNAEIHSSTYSPEWLHQFQSVFFNDTPRYHPVQDGEFYASPRGPIQPWDKEVIKNASLDVEYEELMSKDTSLYKLVKLIYTHGIAIVRGVPVQKNQIEEVASRIGYIRPTGYGKTFDVTFDPDPKTHLSYTGSKFDHHVDLAYREKSPGIQILHCLKAPDPAVHGPYIGGMSFFVDGFYSAKYLQRHYPLHFQILTKTPVTFAFQDAKKQTWYREEWPVIDLDSRFQLKAIHYSNFSMRPPLLPLKQLIPFYEAYRCFANIVRTPSSQHAFFVTPGDLVIFNNRRILHGRSAYDPKKSERFLQGCYMDLDEVLSLYDKLRKDYEN